jgi:hypothetical protein
MSTVQCNRVDSYRQRLGEPGYAFLNLPQIRSRIAQPQRSVVWVVGKKRCARYKGYAVVGGAFGVGGGVLAGGCGAAGGGLAGKAGPEEHAALGGGVGECVAQLFLKAGGHGLRAFGVGAADVGECFVQAALCAVF